MSLTMPPRQTAGISNTAFHWMDPAEERMLFHRRVRALMSMRGVEFLSKLDRGDFDQAIEEDTDHNLAYLVTLSSLGR